MSKTLPTRPNLEHLRGQAKALLSSLRNGDPEAVRAFSDHLPSAAGQTPDQIKTAGFALADAQSVIARKHGFPSWPRLVHHVETVCNFEGSWQFTSLEVEGNAYPEGAYGTSRLIIDGDRFRMESPGANYGGVYELNIECQPNEIDMHFTEGPEEGNTSFGIFLLEDQELKICLGFTGVPRPSEFASRPGTGLALETLRKGGGAPPPASPEAIAAETVSAEGFGEITPELRRLAGEWVPVTIVQDGMVLPSMFLTSGKRVVEGAITTVTFGPELYLSALTKVDPSTSPVSIDYLHTAGIYEGRVQRAILEWIHDGEIRLCMGAVGGPRPSVFESKPGSGFTLSQWKLRR